MAPISRAARRSTSVLAAVAVSGFAAMPAASAVAPAVPLPAADQAITSSSLEWGVRESFRNYIQGPIAQGEWSVSGVSADAAGVVTWQGGAGEFDPETGAGSASFTGGVHYAGHWDHFEEGEPALSVEIENPTVEIDGTGGTLYADVESQNLEQQTMGGTQIALAELSLPEGVDAQEDQVSAVATAALTAEGAEAFAGFYQAGEELDPLSFSFALAPAEEPVEEEGAEAEPGGPAEEAPTAEEPAQQESEQAEPPSSGNGGTSNSTGNSNSSGTSTSSGSADTSSGSGSGSNSGSSSSGGSGSSTSGSSTNSSGSSNTSGSAGPGTSAGSNSSGSGNTGSGGAASPNAVPAGDSVLNSSMAPEAEEAVITETVCTASGVSGATLNWGLRESFRSYIQGGIAQGDWTLNGISYSGGQYVWSGGAGNFDPDTGTGTVGFSGGVHFTGHDGVLDLHISNPAIQVTGPGSAVLVADVISTTMDGDRIDLAGVTFATISGGISVGADTVSASGASVTLTGDGADAFAGFYEPGEALDPISFTFPLTEECHEVTLGADGQPIAGGPGAGGGPLAQTGATVGDLALGSGALLALGLTLMVLRRRRQSETVSITAA